MSEKPKSFAPGIYYGVPMRDYLAAPGLSFSALRLLKRSPLTYKRQRDGMIKSESTPAQEFGTILHSAVLEGRADGFHVRPETYESDDGQKRWNSNATVCKAWMLEHSDKPVITAEQAASVSECMSYVRFHPVSGPLLKDGKAEVSIFAEINGRLFKGRSDYLTIRDDIARDLDLKSCASGDSSSFSKSINDHAYHAQLALRHRILEALGYKSTAWIIALEKGEMPLVNARKLSHAAIVEGGKWIDDAVSLLGWCEADDCWPDYGDWEPGVTQEFDLPQWAYRNEPVELLIGGATTTL